MTDEASNLIENQSHRALVYGEALEEAAQVLEFQQSLAIVIGINDYASGIPCLKTAANDAHRLAQILADDYQYEVELLVENVTLDRLSTLLTEQLPAHVGENDRVVFYFAGHGIALEGEDGPAGYLVPQDGRSDDRNTFLRMDALHDALMQLECRHMLIILDCCFAGTIRWSSTRNISMVPEVIHQERYERFIRHRAWQVITSAAYDQRALDILSGDVLGERGDTAEYKYSPFALALFEALSGAGDVMPKGQGDGVITASELYLYLRDYVEVRAERTVRHLQTPGLWPLRKHDKGEYIFLVPGYELNLPPAPELTDENNPYRGLQPFEEEHADLFFGRQALIKQLATVVADQSLTVVLGASGTGKSSLVQAGLLPALGGTGQVTMRPAEDTRLPEESWFILPPMRPTESPLRELENLLQAYLATADEAITSDSLRSDTQALVNLVTTWSQSNSQQKVLLVVDQFEELITLCRDEAEREQFIQLLGRMLEAHSDSFRLVLTLRSDFEPQLSNTGLKPYWLASRFVVPPMSQAELREAIEGPASARVLYFEPSDLVDRLIDEVIQTPGALPLLSFTLSEMYIKYLERKGNNRALTQADYEALGGVIGSLRNRATEEYKELDEAHRETMQRIMLRMIAIEGGELARRRVPQTELSYPDEAENERVKRVLRELLKARLIVGGESEGEAYVEPAHDALIRAWDKLLVWKTEAEEYLPLQRRLSQAAVDWAGTVDIKKRQGMLWSADPRLPQLVQLLGKNALTPTDRTWLNRWVRRWLFGSQPGTTLAGRNWLNQQETQFVQQSVVQRLKNFRQLISSVATAFIIVTGLLILSLFLYGQSVTAQNAQATEIINRTTAEANAEERRIAAVTAEKIADEQRIAAVTSEANAVNAAATAEARRIEAERQAALARSRALAAQAENVQDNQLAILLALEAVYQTHELMPETTTTEASQGLYNALTRSRWQMTLHSGHTDEVNSVAWNAAGTRIVTASKDGSAKVWDTQIGRELFSFNAHADSVTQAAWSPDDSRIVTASRDSTAKIWNAEDGAELFTLTGHNGEVNHAAWNADGTRIVTTSADGTAKIWDAQTGQELFTLNGHTRSVTYAAWSFDDTRIVTASADGTAKIWDAQIGQELFDLKGHTSSVTHAAWSPNDTRIVTTSGDTTAKIWDAQTGQEIFTLSGHTNWINHAAWVVHNKRPLIRAQS